jgi:GH15 family glucan-1,4-alpha-glucosidase
MPPPCWQPSSDSCPDDERLRASVLAIADEWTEHGFVLRTAPARLTTACRARRAPLLICSFWLVSTLAIIGEEQLARDLMERLLRVASPLGLFAEEFDVDTGRHSATCRRPFPPRAHRGRLQDHRR